MKKNVFTYYDISKFQKNQMSKKLYILIPCVVMLRYMIPQCSCARYPNDHVGHTKFV
jgi:hypothetical protein